MIDVLVIGANGKMGQVAIKAIEQHSQLNLVGPVGREQDLQTIIEQCRPQVAVHFAGVDTVFEQTKQLLSNHVAPVVGSSGLLPEQVVELQQFAAEQKMGGIIVPNFCIGAVLMMRFAKQAAHFFPSAEIIELHHDKKADAPSGTSIKTAELISETRENLASEGKEVLPGARGASLNNVPIHSVRLPGLLAHQEVIFGQTGELLTLRHDSFSRDVYIPGIALACEQVPTLKELLYGLDNLLGND